MSRDRTRDGADAGDRRPTESAETVRLDDGRGSAAEAVTLESGSLAQARPASDPTLTIGSRPQRGGATAESSGLPRRSVGPDIEADYRPVDELGRGGQAVVLAASSRALGQEVALKRLHRPSPQHVARFLAEARLTAALAHQGVPPAYELAQDAHGQPILAMRRVPGETWAACIGRDRNRDLEILTRIADTVASAHAAGWMHRDLKPANTMLSPGGGVWVMDWGLALPLGPDGLVRCEGDEGVAGTPSYMAPEMARGETAALGKRSDVYLLAALLCEVLSGRPPRGGDLSTCLRHAATGALPQLPDGPLGDLARRGLDPDPARRPADAAAFRSELGAALQAERAGALLKRAIDLAVQPDGCGRALAALDAADGLPGSDPAAAGALRSAIRLAAAEAALGRGEWSAARDWLDHGDPAHGAALARCTAGREAAERAVAEERRLHQAEERARAAESRAWVPALALTCDAPHGWLLRHGEAAWLGGCLRWSGGHPRVLTAPLALPGDLRLRLEGRFAESPADLALFFGADREAPDGLRQIESGYQVKIGAYGNTISLLIRRGRRLAVRPGPALRAAAWQRLEVERRGGLIRVLLDGEPILSAEDPEPLGGGAWGALGFGAVGEIRHLEAQRLEVPAEDDLLATAERLLGAGRRSGAAELLESLAFAALPPADEARRTRLLALARRRLRIASESETLRQRIAARWPRARVVEEQDGFYMNLWQEEVADLSPIAGMPFVELDLGGNRIRDLAPLAGMPLTALSIDGNLVEDLSPLADMPLRSLTAKGNRIRDLAPLAGMPLSILHLSRNRIRDPAPLAGMPLSVLLIDGNPIGRLDALAGMGLSSLTLGGRELRDLSPIGGMALCSLRLMDIAIETPLDLSGMPLADLALEHCAWRSLPRLPDSLRVFHVMACPLRDLGPLAGLRLRSLYLSRTAAEDLAPIDSGFLERACLRGAFRDLAPLAGAPLTWLYLEAPAATSLAPLAGAPLEVLIAIGCGVAELPPGLGAGLRALACHGSPLAAHVASGWPGGPVPSAPGCPQLKMALAAEADPARLRATARTVHGRQLAYVPVCCDHAAAERLAAAAGGRIAEVVPVRDLLPFADRLEVLPVRAHGPDILLTGVDGQSFSFDPASGLRFHQHLADVQLPFIIEWPA